MNFLIRLEAAVFRVALIFWFYCFSRYWSRLYRLIWDRKYVGTPLATYRTIPEIVSAISPLVWVADGWRELWDATASPQRVQWLINHGNVKIGDCDEFAIYLVNVICRSLDLGLLQTWPAYDAFLAPVDARFLTVTWICPGGKTNGHNVCLIEWIDNDHGYDSFYSYMDYGQPNQPRKTVSAVVQDILKDYCGDGVVLLSWALHDENLDLLEVH